MAKPSPELLREWTSGRWSGNVPPAVDGFCIDSRQLRRGDMFIALRTDKRDGHDFVAAAAQDGAACALVEREVDVEIPQLVVEDTVAALQQMGAGNRQRFTGRLVGLTGSCGKTSTKDLLSLLLEGGGGKVLRTEGNLNNYLGLPLTLLRLDPDEHEFAVVETGINQRGEMRVLADMAQPDVAVITNFAAAHLEGLGSLEGVAEEKAILAQGVPEEGAVFMPLSCFRYREQMRLMSQGLFLTYDFGSEQPWWREGGPRRLSYALERKGGGWKMEITDPEDRASRQYTLPLVSRGMCSNAALAISVARFLGIEAGKILGQLEKWTPGAFRGEVRELQGVAYYIDCYNANPASVEDAVSAFRDRFPNRRKLYLLGCMNELGPESDTLHRELGERLQIGGRERVCVLGRQAESLARGLREGASGAVEVSVAADIEAARACLRNFLTEGGDAVLLKGSRSYRLEQLLPEESSNARGEARAEC